MALSEQDMRFFRAALALGRRNLGATAPNPAVGALVVRDGVVVGRGWTAPGGRPHAETQALAQAGDLARGATLYVTLEPCAHHGKTPPCAEAVAAAGIARVVGGPTDPDDRVAGEGYGLLRRAGLEVEADVLPEEGRRAHRGHILRATEGRPMVTLKIAETADGQAAGGPHDRRLAITGAAANLRTHVLRALHDAIMVGVGTALGDDPLMTVRLPGCNRKPLRVVLDARLDLPLRSRLVVGARDFPTLVFCGAEAAPARRVALEDHGVEIATCTLTDGRIDLGAALRQLGARGITRVFSEGGPRVGAALIAQALADEMILFTAPKPLGREGVESLSPQARETLADPGVYRIMEQGLLGADRFIHYERN
ncbi:bifunctional diaminohydroxyphosphoribosylaminopyrimidine deaminase/5-amino-6-(5-phosphoribosylamino)uracil reductase RibD [Rhodoblastus acidophilus]|uniref:Riboflavin biosynthesis protein RibD n=1 Tax=Candidatus Rhodoblastus alkanivorans TaxID=2954117 RepID=A0ABS9Z643_9HYPH|nr:bifunctional diaminohydroxyphosphoribosylaminopyrimidine deaminase/5-amino-6-(5-phosphoribosylamino)uracil reductase RibD [Candidatus Rhodoblastus alkanivorans]MCI4679144.1 bifunctional diaminohydroxyphosphoribosylaminopyrimidine deaminase/5-amino-6-(5-phosphoribosylamino)uracil reductase RibD [Candidatus Rhodoblastus alkanivorans]MCI4683140.1 bifunctional diaminohydroxyphosphoribosylaminopyrimidine deaminase/5-amino-6-(5-phosphoribosylamino)uracil reductase RibD [Candidatus Rhodoblastus alkan